MILAILDLVLILALVGSGALLYVLRRKPEVAPPLAPRAVPFLGENEDSVVVVIGNDAVAQVTEAPDEHGLVAHRRVARPDLGRRHTTFGPFPADWPPGEMLQALVHAWPHHSDAPPAWLESNNAAFEALAAAELGCAVGCPDDWQEDNDAVA